MVNFDKMPCIYWSTATKISHLQRRIILYSIMYYEHDESCVSDSFYDEISHQLVELMKICDPEEFKKTTYYYAMHDFDGSTGFYIYSRLTKQDKEYLSHLASFIHNQWKSDNKKTKRRIKNDKAK